MVFSIHRYDFSCDLLTLGACQVAPVVKNLPSKVENISDTRFDPWVEKIPWRRAWQPTPVFPAWEIPWTEEPGGLQSIESKRVRHDWSDWACTMSGVGVFVAYKRDANPYCLPSGSWTIRVDTKKSRLHKLCLEASFQSWQWHPHCVSESWRIRCCLPISATCCWLTICIVFWIT